jgi:hypothetical protein
MLGLTGLVALALSQRALGQTALPYPPAAPYANTAPAVDPRSPYRETMAERFAEANTTHDGKLTFAQAQTGFPAMARLFDLIDHDRHGYITLEDIRAYYSDPAHKTTAARFAEANATHDGRLTYAQAAAGFPAIARLFDVIDHDHRGYITMDDIKAYYDLHGSRRLSSR